MLNINKNARANKINENRFGLSKSPLLQISVLERYLGMGLTVDLC